LEQPATDHAASGKNNQQVIILTVLELHSGEGRPLIQQQPPRCNGFVSNLTYFGRGEYALPGGPYSPCLQTFVSALRNLDAREIAAALGSPLSRR
jgi:hypothetical protein